MMKISEIPERRSRTRHQRSANGNRYSYQEDYYVYKQVPTISGGKRIYHYIFDSLNIALIYIPFLIGFAFFVNLIGNHGTTWAIVTLLFFAIIMLIINALYYIFFEYKTQRTPGKRTTSSIVVNEYGQKPSLKQIIKRTLIRFIPFELYSCLGNPSLGLHDEWSKTFVIEEEVLQALMAEIRELEENESTIEKAHNKRL